MTDILTATASLLAENGAPPSGNPLGASWVPLVLMVVMFYFLLIRPQQRQRKELQKRIDAMKTGDRVVTTAGIHALVHNIKDKTVVLKVAEGTMIEFDKQAVAAVHSKESAASTAK